MPKAERTLVQIRLTAAERQRIKSLSARQGLTLQKAVVEAFNAWEKELRTQGSGRIKTTPPNPPAQPNSESASWGWLKQVTQLDWTQCPEVELLEDGVHQVRVLQATDAPLSQVLRAVADGLPLFEVAEIFDLEISQLMKVLDFAGAPPVSNALN